MNINIFTKKDDKEQLHHYSNLLAHFQIKYKTRSKLNLNQIKKLDEFTTRAIKYCNTGKYTKYKKGKWRRNVDVLATHEHLVLYNELFGYINSMIKEVHNDTKLSLKHKRILAFYLSLIQCHVRGKLNRKIN